MSPLQLIWGLAGVRLPPRLLRSESTRQALGVTVMWEGHSRRCLLVPTGVCPTEKKSQKNGAFQTRPGLGRSLVTSTCPALQAWGALLAEEQWDRREGLGGDGGTGACGVPGGLQPGWTPASSSSPLPPPGPISLTALPAPGHTPAGHCARRLVSTSSLGVDEHPPPPQHCQLLRGMKRRSRPRGHGVPGRLRDRDGQRWTVMDS